MINFGEFLTEATTEEKLKHLEHAEDHHINAGKEGFTHAVNTLVNTHMLLQGKNSKASISTKYDGSPSVVFGHHPETGKFFVASKSAFNKNPKLNYTPEDIKKNHGHAPGLVSKLTHALNHLRKVSPRHGIYQGDFMYAKDDEDVKQDSKGYHFKPNTITYSVNKKSPEFEKVKKAKIGVVVHTAYKGKTFNDMKAQFNPDLSHFGSHSDVHLISPLLDTKNVNHSEENRKKFDSHMHQAHIENEKMKNYNHLEGHVDSLKTYINHSVTNNVKPSVEEYKAFLHDRGSKEVAKVKTDKSKQAKIEAMNSNLRHVDENKDAFESTLQIHHHLQQAKNSLVDSLAKTKYEFEHSIEGQKVKPEGHVVVVNNRPTKLVDRYEFSRLNLLSKPR